MRAYEFITEHISVTPIQDQIERDIEKFGKRKIPDNDAHEILNDLKLMKNDSSWVTKFKTGGYIFARSLWEYINNTLSEIVSKNSNVKIRIVTVESKDENFAGTANSKNGFHLIELNIKNLTRNLFYDIYEVILNSGGISIEDDKVEYLNEHECIHILKQIYINELHIFDDITGYIDTIIHEVVHIIQHDRQKYSGKDCEYRSKISPSKERFYQAVRAIAAGTATEYDRKLYYSSLQEIPAHAHSVVSKYVKNYFSWVEDLDNLSEEDIISIKYNLDLIKSEFNLYLPRNNTVQYYNQVFNKPDEKELYNIYKRFRKLLYLEFNRYVNHWENVVARAEQHRNMINKDVEDLKQRHPDIFNREYNES